MVLGKGIAMNVRSVGGKVMSIPVLHGLLHQDYLVNSLR